MDNNKDRQFYWEVKDFINRIPSEPKVSQKKPDIVSSVKVILEQNKVYKQTSFEAESNAVGVAQKIISTIQGAEKGYDPKCVGYTKNKDVHAFNSLNEGIFDYLLGKVGKGEQTLSPEQARANARKKRSEIKSFEQQFTATQSNLPQISKEIDVEEMDYVPGTKLTPEQKAKRELESQLSGEKAEDEIRQAEAERLVAGAPETQTNEKGNWFSPKPSWVTAANTPQQAPEVPAEAPQEETPEAEETSEVPSEPEQQDSGEFVGVDITQQTPEQISAMNDPSRGGQSGRFGGDGAKAPTGPNEQDKYLEARKAYWRRRNTERRQEAEDNLTRTQFGKPRSAYQAGQMAVNQQAQQRAAEGSGDWSDEKIERMAKKETELRFRTPEQREAKRKENEAVVSSLAKAAEEVRAKEAKEKAPQVATGAKTDSASKTVMQTYRA